MEADHVEGLFDRHRDAMQRPRRPIGERLVGRRRLLHCRLTSQLDDRVQVRVDGIDACKQQRRQLARRDLPVAHHARRIGRRLKNNLLVHQSTQ